jgi:FAD synthase
VSDFPLYTWDDVLCGRAVAPGKKTSLTVGVFDGPHIGHKTIFRSVTDFSRTHSGVLPGLITFDFAIPGSRKFAKLQQGLISTMAQRLDGCRKYGFAFAIIIDFSGDFSKIEGREFLSLLVRHCGMSYLCEGDDFRFGYNNSCGVREIGCFARELGFDFEVKESVEFKDHKVSSSRIRADVREGRFADAAAMLERPYCLDCSAVQWVLTENKDAFSGKKASFFQALPDEGVYRVTARSDGALFPAEITVSETEISCVRPVTEIIFGEQ